MGKYAIKYKAFYDSKEWHCLRRQVLLDNSYLCVECKNKGIIRAASQVHHKIPIEKDYSKRLEYDNLESLCDGCHNEKHDRRSGLQRFIEAKGEGN